jgi:hypothetical protein
MATLRLVGDTAAPRPARVLRELAPMMHDGDPLKKAAAMLGTAFWARLRRRGV